MSEPSFTIKHRYVLGLGMWLSKLALIGRESRERTKFVEMLQEDLNEIEKMRLEILKKYADKDDKGELVMIEEEETKSKKYSIPDEKMSEFNNEYMSFLDEDFVISGPGNIQRLKIVKSIVLDTQEKIAPELASNYNVWCESFEAMPEVSPFT